jgi:hypothetical protein
MLFNLRFCVCVVLKKQFQFYMKSGRMDWLEYVPSMGEMAGRSEEKRTVGI